MPHKNPEARARYQQTWRRHNQQRLNEQARTRYAREKTEQQKKSRLRRERNRRHALHNLGGKCCWCGETDPAFLEIDHIRAGTGETGVATERRAARGLTSGLQLLCANHHRFKTTVERIK